MEFLNLHWGHLLLACGGMAIHVLLKLAALSYKEYFKKYKFNMLASLLMIPLLLLMVTDTSLSDVMPLNNVTAVLAGYQTNSVFKALMGIYTKKLGTNDNKTS